MDGVVSTPDASRFSNQPASSSPPRADGLSALSTALSAADRSHTEGDCDPRCSPSKTTEDLLAGSSKKGPDEVLDTTPSSVSLMGNAPIEVQSTPDKTELGTVSLLRSPRGAGVTTAAASSLLDSAPFRMIPPSASARRRASSLSSELDRDNISLRHHAEVRAMLVVAERELADARKMCDQRGLRIENLESSLERSRATQQEMRERYAEDMGAVNSEHEAQIIQLRDQLRVLKQVSEGAMADKLQSAAEAEKQKKELLELVDRERQEKSRIMAEYREQTEALIAEQGHEITMLQSALEKVKSEYDLLAREHEKLMDDRSRLQDEVVETQSQIDRERFDAAKLLKDMQTRLLEEREQLREELGVKHEEKLRDSARQNAQYQQLVDQLHNATEALATQNEEHVQEVEQLKYIHLQELRAVQQDLDAVRSAHSTQADSHRAELERVSKREAAAVETLRQAQSAARGEQERLLMETTRQLEELQSQHRAKVGQLQSSIAEVTHEAAVERQRRKDVEAELEVVRLSAEQLEKSLSSLKSQLEESSSDKKVQERLLEQQRQQDVGELQGKLRSLSTDLAYAQQQVQQLNVEQRNLREDLALKTALLEQTKKEHVQALEQMRSEVEHSSQSHNVKEGERQKQVETLKEQKRLVEAALADAQRTLTETAAQLKTSQSKLEEAAVERQATAVRQKDLAVLCEDLRQSLNHEQSRSEAITTDKLDVEQQLQDARLRYEELEVKVALLERKLQEEQLDQQRLAKTHEGKIENLEMRHKAELATQRVSVEQLRNEIGHLRESLAAKEAALRELRETMGQQQRDAAMRDGSVQEVIENLKEAHAAERRKLDELLNDLRSDLAKSQATCSRYEKILSQYNRDSDAQRAELEAALELSEQSRAKLHDDAKCREQLNQELQGTVRLITSRLGAYEEESKQLQTELRETHRKAQDAQTMIGRKEATIGQLQAKLRAYEARGGSL